MEELEERRDGETEKLVWILVSGDAVEVEDG